MSCVLEYNKEKEVIGVLNKEGKYSKVFNKINSLPNISVEKAIEIQKNIFANDISDDSSISLITDRGDTVATYKEALKESDNSFQVLVGDHFVATLSNNTNPNTLEGLVNNLVLNDLIKDETSFDNGKKVYQLFGESGIRVITSENLTRDFIKSNNFGKYDMIYDEAGNFQLNKNPDVSNKSYKELAKEYGSGVAKSILGNRIIGEILDQSGKNSISDMTEEELRDSLKTLLNEMGVSLTTIDEYIKNHKIRRGVDTSAEALADIANSVIAYNNGDISTDTLLEETFHFIIEGTPESELAEALEEVTGTDIYKSIYKRYYDLFRRQGLSEEEIEILIRKEALAKQIVKNIQEKRGVSEKEQGIFQRIVNLINNFFNRLTISKESESKIQTLTDQVGQMILRKGITEGFNTNSFSGRTFVMYSSQPSNNPALDKAYNTLKGLAVVMSNQAKFLSKNRAIGSRASIENLERVREELDNEQTMNYVEIATVTLLKEIEKKISYVNESLDRAENENRALNVDENTVLNQLVDSYRTILSQLNENIKSTKDTKDPQGKNNFVVIDKLDKVISDSLLKISVLEGKKRNMSQGVYETLVEEIISQRPDYDVLTEEDIEDLKQRLLTSEKDTNMLYAYYGQLTHASDPTLNMLGHIIGKMYNSAELNNFERVKNFIAKIEEKGYRLEDINKILHKEGDFYINPTDQKVFLEALNKIKAEIHYDILEKGGKDVSQEDLDILIQYYNDPASVEMSDELRLKSDVEKLNLNERFERDTMQYRELMYKPEYYEQRDDNYKKWGISDVTKVVMRQLSLRRGELTRKTMKQGKVYLTSSTKTEADELARDRRKHKSVYNQDGSLKDGLEIIQKKDYEGLSASQQAEYLPTSGGAFVKKLADASDEATIAYDLHKIDTEFKNSQGANTATYSFDKVSDEFWQELLEMERSGKVGRQEIIDFFSLNVGINFPQEFWESFSDQGPSTNDVMEQYIKDGLASDEFIMHYNSLRKNTIHRSTLIRQYQDTKNVSNYLVGDMNRQLIDEIRGLSEDIEALNRSLYNKDFRAYKDKFDNENNGTNSSRIEFENKPNESWFKNLADYGIDYNVKNLTKIKDYAKQHMTTRKAGNTEEVVNYLNKIINDKFIEESEKQRIKKLFGNRLTEDEFRDINKHNAGQIGIDFIESNLDVYYKALAPAGTYNLISELYNPDSTTPVSEIVKQLEGIKGITLSNHHSFYESSEFEFLNPNYDSTLTGTRYQAKLSTNPQFRDKEFHEKFGIVYDSEGKPSVTRNQNEYEVWQSAINFNTEVLNDYGELGFRNIYEKYNVSKTTMDRLHDVLKGQNVKSIYQDWKANLTKYRIDEYEEGEVIDGESAYKTLNIKIIPKQFMQKLEIGGVRSDDYVHSMMLVSNSASLYKYRNEYFSDAMAVRNTLIDKGVVGSKKVEASNTYNMMNNYIDSNFYGINETANRKVKLPILGEVDIAKMLSQLHSLVRWKNLSNNVIVPITSYFTARIQFYIETLVEQYVDKDSVRMARKTFNSKFSKSVGETLNLNSKSEIVVLGEYYSLFDLTNRFENANKNKAGRFLANIGFGLHTVANFEPISMALLSNLYGHRLYNGNVVDYKAFEKTRLQEGATKDTIRSDWKNLSDKTMKDYITVTEEGTVVLEHEKFFRDSGSDNIVESAKEFTRIQELIRNRGKKLIERIDGNIREEERTALQRNALGKYVMTHKGWLSIALSNKLKSKHFNMQTLQEEEGTYVTGARVLYNYLARSYKAVKGDINYSEIMEGLSEMEKVNMKRLSMEIAVASTIFVIALVAGAYGDRDDKKDIWSAQMIAYLIERSANETSSQQLGLFAEIYKTIKEPIVGLSQVADMFDASKAFSLEEIKRGRYKGLQDYQAYLIGNLAPLKQGFVTGSAENLYYQRNAYKHFNDIAEWQPLSIVLNKELMESLIHNK